MAHNFPAADDYLRLFARWQVMVREDVGPTEGRDFGDVYKGTDDERYRLLFEHICRLLVQRSAYNLAIPHGFRRTAQQWIDGDPATLKHMGDVQNRHFMLSDLYDWVYLNRAMAVGGC